MTLYCGIDLTRAPMTCSFSIGHERRVEGLMVAVAVAWRCRLMDLMIAVDSMI